MPIALILCVGRLTTRLGRVGGLIWGMPTRAMSRLGRRFPSKARPPSRRVPATCEGAATSASAAWLMVEATDSMNEPISGALDRLTTGGGRAIMVLQAQARAVWLRAMVLRRRWLSRVTPDRGVARATNEPVSGALVKLTSESRKVILALAGTRSRTGAAGAAARADRAQEIVRRAARMSAVKSSPAFSSSAWWPSCSAMEGSAVARFRCKASFPPSKRRSTASFPTFA